MPIVTPERKKPSEKVFQAKGITEGLFMILIIVVKNTRNKLAK